MMSRRLGLDPIVLDNIYPTLKWVKTEDPKFDAKIDIDMTLGGDEADLVVAAPWEPELVVASSKRKQPMEVTSHASQPIGVSIRSTSIVIGGNDTTEPADEAEASLDSNPDDVYVALVDDLVSSGGDEFDHGVDH